MFTTHDWEWFLPPIYMILGMVYDCLNHMNGNQDVDFEELDVPQEKVNLTSPENI